MRYTRYMGFRLDSARQLLLNLLERGVDPTTASPFVLHRPSLVMSTLGENKLDLRMLGALVDAGATCVRARA